MSVATPGAPWHPGVAELKGGSAWWRAKVGALRIAYSTHPDETVARIAVVAHRGGVYDEVSRLPLPGLDEDR